MQRTSGKNRVIESPIWIYRSAEGEIQLWTNTGKGLNGMLWSRYHSSTPKGYANITAGVLKQKPDYGPCWWGQGEESPDDRGLEYVGRLGRELIESDETGNKQIQDLLKSLKTGDWTDWEQNFIYELTNKKYQNLTTRQKAVVSDLIEKV